MVGSGPSSPDHSSRPWHTQATGQVLDALGVHATHGLDDEEATLRLTHYGANELVERDRKSPLHILWEQFSSAMVLILIGAAVVSGSLGKVTETIAIAAIVVLFAVLGFVQEYRAEQAIAALKKLTVPTVRVRRNGTVGTLSARELVPGDIVLLETGNVVPADLRLIESINLRTQEAALTGESEPVEKSTQALTADQLALGDRRNMGHMGTVVTYGRGAGVVVETGMRTELGKIAALIQNVTHEVTPLQQRLDTLGKQLAVAGVVVALLVLAIGVLRGEPVAEMFLTAVSVAVAVVPEGLPAVVTVTLALGAQRMLRRRALVRKLAAVETLGAVTVICSDKTGTLTENRMTVTVIDVAGHSLEIHDGTAVPATAAPVDWWATQPPQIELILAGGVLCNDATLSSGPLGERVQAVGDPTEGALLVAAAQAGLWQEDLQKWFPRVAELPFDSERKRMTTVHRLLVDPLQVPGLPALFPHAQAPYVAVTKGAVDSLVKFCSTIWVDTRPEPLDQAWIERLEAANERLAHKGMRVLGVAVRWLEATPTPAQLATLENDLVFVGLFGMVDPPRPEVKAAVQRCTAAGIRTVMITGDHPLTARYIAAELGIAGDGKVLTGQDLNELSSTQLGILVDEVSVYARVSPEHKLQIVEALQRKGHVVAMTGDGVNDSPALKKANIGVAMGITGTDVSKEAAEMVLVDDNFATIVAAVEEGRAIYDNIRRFVKFSIAGNIGKVLVMLLAPLTGISVALLPLQLLWLNLMTDGLLGLGLGMEPAEKNTMQRPPRSPRTGLLSDGLGLHILWVGVVIGLTALCVGYAYYNPADPANTTWQTMIFTTLAFLQIGQALSSRSSHESIFALGVRSNPLLAWMVVATTALQLLVLYAPFLGQFFKVTPLAMTDLLVCLLVGMAALVAIELEKLLLRRRSATLRLQPA
jgi:P-type Ca2+ transporter type 2C